MRIGVIGVGRIGYFHLKVLKAHPGVSGLALTDADSARASKVGAEIGADVAPTVKALIDSVDAVVIASPTDTHADLLHMVIDAGKPCFCEKPVALDLEATRSVANHARDAGAIVQIGFQRRFDRGYGAARERVSSGALGNVYAIRIAAHDSTLPHESYIPGSGGIFRDMFIHDFDIVRWVIGQDITEVFVRGAVLADPMFARNNDVDTVAATLRFSDGALGVMTGTRHDPLGQDVRLEVFGSRDSVVAGWDDRTPMRSMEPGGAPLSDTPYKNFLDRFEPAYVAELNAFVDVAHGRVENPCGVEDAERALCVAVACDVSLKENRPVSPSEIQS